MSDDFPNRQTIRLPGYDYSENGYYFVTVCSHGMEQIFGEIINGKMVLNDVGEMIKMVWFSLPKHHVVKLDEFQIMPNHIHFVLILLGSGAKNNESGGSRPAPTIGTIIGLFKSTCSKQIHDLVGARRASPVSIKQKQIFQRNYYEHIIRNEREYKQIVYYIRNNPQNWENDRNYV